MDGNTNTGKNYLSYHVIIKYIQDFIDLELKELENHTIKILALEEKLKLDLEVPGIDSPVLLKGKLDRIDEFNGVTRIIDYKTGKVERRNVEIKDWDCLIEDEQYSKAFQLLCYSYMYLKIHPNKELLAGIISVKNLREGLLMYAKKEAVGSQKTSIIGDATLITFENHLYKLIREIFNPEVPFLEKQL